jgi:CO/xanthine dehydrogenase FAD-binding subunit
MIEYCTPSDLQEALALMISSKGQALVIAGGTDMLLDLSKHKKRPHLLIDITRIPGLSDIQVENDCVEIGAAVTFAKIKKYPFFWQQVHALTDAARSVGAAGIQTTATWVGNLVQAMPAADGAIVALALEAEVCIADQSGTSCKPVESLFMGPGKSTIDSSRQVVTHLRFPIPDRPWGTAWQRVGRRTSMTLPIVTCAVKVIVDEGRIQRAVVALGPVASRPFRAHTAEVFLAGKIPHNDALAEAGRLAQAESDPRSSAVRASREYRLAIIPVMVRQALATAVERALDLKIV